MAAKVSVQVARLRADVKPLKASVKEVKGEIKGVMATIEEFNRRMDKQAAATRKVAAENARLRAQYKRTGAAANQLAASNKKVTMSLARMSVGFISVTTVVYALGRALTAGIRGVLSFDRQLVLIQKTAKLSVADLGRLENKIKDISVFRGIDRDTIAGGAVVAGRLGVSDVNDLARLADLGAALEKSTDTTAEQAIQAITRLHTLSNTGFETIEKTADALVHLGNKAPIAEQAILDLSVKLGAVLGRFGAAPPQILAVAASLGIAEGQAEGAATFFEKLLLAMVNLYDQGGPQFSKFADVMGRDVKQLGKDIEDNLIDTSFEFFENLKKIRAADQPKVLAELFGLTDIRGLRALFRINPTLRQTLGLVDQAGGALTTEEAIRQASLSGEFDSSVQALKAGFLAIADVIDDALLPAFNAMARGVRWVQDLFGDDPTRLENMTAQQAVYDPSNWRLLTQAIAAANDKSLPPGVRRYIDDIMTQEGRAIDDPDMFPSRQALEDIVEAHALARSLNNTTMDFETRNANAARLNEIISTQPQNTVDALIANAPPGTPATSTGATSGNQRFGNLTPEQLRVITEQAYGGYGGGRGLGVSATRNTPDSILALLEQRDARLRARAYGGYAGGLGVSASMREEDRIENLETHHRLQTLRQRAKDERKLLNMFRSGARREDIRYHEDVMRLNRDYYRARAELTGDALQAELDSITRQREALKTPKQEENEALANQLTDSVANVIRDGGSIKDAWKSLMDTLAASLYEEAIIKPFKEAFSSLLGQILSNITMGVNRGGAGGILDFAASAIMGGFPGLAEGGVVRSPGMALVGERGPEVLRLPQGASVAPLSGNMGMGTGLTNNFNIVSEDRVAIKNVMREEIPNIIRAVEASMITKTRGNTRIARAFT